MSGHIELWVHDGVRDMYREGRRVMHDTINELEEFKIELGAVGGDFVSYFNPFNKAGAAISVMVKMTNSQRLAFTAKTGYVLSPAPKLMVS